MQKNRHTRHVFVALHNLHSPIRRLSSLHLLNYYLLCDRNSVALFHHITEKKKSIKGIMIEMLLTISYNLQMHNYSPGKRGTYPLYNLQCDHKCNRRFERKIIKLLKIYCLLTKIVRKMKKIVDEPSSETKYFKKFYNLSLKSEPQCDSHLESHWGHIKDKYRKGNQTNYKKCKVNNFMAINITRVRNKFGNNV